MSCVFLPGLYFLERADSQFEVLWLNTPLNVLTNGDAAVQAISFVINKRMISLFILLLGFYLFCVNISLTGMWVWVNRIPVIRDNPEALRAVGIAIVLMVTSKTPLIQKAFSIKPLNWLGSISAYTYAFHWPILLSVGCGVYLLLSDYMDYHFVVLIASTTVFITTFFLAYLYKLALPKVINVEKRLSEKARGLVKKNK